MNVSLFFKEIVSKYPLLFVITTALLIMQSLFAGVSILTIAPIIDLLLNSNIEQASPVTQRFAKLLKMFGLPVHLVSFVVIFFVFLTLKNMFLAFAKHFIIRIKFTVLRDLNTGTLKDFFRARWLFFTQIKQGTILNTFLREIAVVGDSLGQMGILIANGVQLIIFLAVPMYITWKCTSICLALAVVFVMPLVLLGKLSYRLGQKVTSTGNMLGVIIQENLAAAKVIMGFGLQRRNIEHFSKSFDYYRSVTIKSETLSMATTHFYEPMGMIALIITLVIARSMEVPIAELALVIWGLRSMIPLVGEIVRNKNHILNILPRYEQVKYLREEAVRLKQKSGTKMFDCLNQTLSLQNVSFAYPGREYAIRDINLQISRGKMIALVGESGGGKSTLIDLLMGFLSPEKGNIMIDGIPLERYDIDSYRQKVGYVPQDAILFHMSVRDNLLWAKESSSEQELWEACRLANAEEFVRQLPQGLDTIIGDRGVRLSGGQCQRLALARAVIRKPELLILDEATSALDTESERLVQQSIEQIAKTTTVVVIAHRLSTIVNADYIYVLKEGEIVEEATYQELIKRDGCFNQMVQLQSLR